MFDAAFDIAIYLIIYPIIYQYYHLHKKLSPTSYPLTATLPHNLQLAYTPKPASTYVVLHIPKPSPQVDTVHSRRTRTRTEAHVLGIDSLHSNPRIADRIDGRPRAPILQARRRGPRLDGWQQLHAACAGGWCCCCWSHGCSNRRCAGARVAVGVFEGVGAAVDYVAGGVAAHGDGEAGAPALEGRLAALRDAGDVGVAGGVVGTG